MGSKVPHRHKSSTWLSRQVHCVAPDEHDRERFHLEGAIALGDDYALAAGLCSEYWSVYERPGFWKVMRCGCMFAAVPMPLPEDQNGQGVEERTESPAHHAQVLEADQSRVLPLDGSVSNTAHHVERSPLRGPIEHRRSA